MNIITYKNKIENYIDILKFNIILDNDIINFLNILKDKYKYTIIFLDMLKNNNIDLNNHIEDINPTLLTKNNMDGLKTNLFLLIINTDNLNKILAKNCIISALHQENI